MAEIGVGIIGFGMATRVFHAPFVSAVPGLRLRSIVERSGDEAAAAYPEAAVVRSVPALLADPAIALVVVATPNATHFELAKEALAAGKHVVIDKPFTPTSAEATELIELARAKGVVLAPFHNRRWDGDFLTVRRLLAEGRLGRVVTIESHYDRYLPMRRESKWKETGGPANGLLMDLGPHLVDQAVALFGVPPRLTASVRIERKDTEIEDAFDICLEYPELRYWCRSTLLAADAAPRFLVHGTNGSFRKYGLDPQEPALKAGARVPRMGEGDWLDENEEMYGTLTLCPVLSDPTTLMASKVKTERGDYREFYASVRDAIEGKAKLAVPTEEGYTVIRLLELARESSRTGRTVEV